MKPLTKEFMVDREAAVKTLNKFDAVIKKRIDYIANTLCDIFKEKKKSWEFMEGDDLATFENNVDSEMIYIQFEPSLFDNPILTKDGKELFFDGIPLRWLYEDFEEEVKDGIKAYKKMREEQIKKEKDKKAGKKEKEEKILKNIKNKLSKDFLTKDEIEFLKKKFDIEVDG